MSKINNTITNPQDIIVGLLIYGYSRQSYLRHVKYKDEDGVQKEMTGERVYETVVSLLSKGALYIEMLDDDKLTILPETDKTKYASIPQFTEVFSGKYKELAAIQHEIDKREKKDEQD